MKRQRMKSTNEFKSDLSILNQSVDVVGEYVSSNTPVLARCKLCNKLFNKRPSDLKNGMMHNCTKKKWVTPVYTKRQSDALLKKIHNVYWNGNGVDIISSLDSNMGLKCRCSICGNEWENTLDSLSKKCICDICNKKYSNSKFPTRRSHLYALLANSYGIRVTQKDGSIIYCHCDVCSADFKIEGYMKRQKIVCPNCKVQKKRAVKNGMTNIQRKCDKTGYCFTHNDFQCGECLMETSKYYSVDEVFHLISQKNNSISIISDKPVLIDAKTEIECRCNVCGTKYLTRPIYLLGGLGGCKPCSMSKGERDVRCYLENRHIDFVQEKSFDDLVCHPKLRFGFYLPEQKVAIEYDGLQHFKPVNFSGSNKNNYVQAYEEQLKRDKLKESYCKKKKIFLIRIKYNEDVKEKLDDILDCHGSK